MNADTPPCPRCASKQTAKNGYIHNGKQNHKCKNCGWQFVEDPHKKLSAKRQRSSSTDCYLRSCRWQVLLERPRSPNHGYRATSTKSTRWSRNGLRAGRKRGHLSVQGDEVRFFIGSKECKKWIWLALDTATREIVGVFIGSRGKAGTKI